MRGEKAVCSVWVCYHSRLTSFYQLPVRPKKVFYLLLMLSVPSGLLFSVPLKYQTYSSCKSHDKWRSIWALLMAVLKSLLSWMCIPWSWLNQLLALGSGGKPPSRSPLFPDSDRSWADFFCFVCFDLWYRTLIPLIFSVLILWYIAVTPFVFFLPSFVFCVFLKSMLWPGMGENNEEKMFWGSHRLAIYCMVACIWINSFRSFHYFILLFSLQ